MKKITAPNTITSVFESTGDGLRLTRNRNIDSGDEIRIGKEETRAFGKNYIKVVNVIGTKYYVKVEDLDPIRSA